jgi:TonB family protein
MRHIIASTIMLSSMLFPAVANASPSSDDVTASTPNLRVSTGVTAPSLAQSISIQIPDGLSKSFVPMDAQVGLSLTVDSNGHPQNVKVVKSSNPYWDARVVDAIQKSHFHPGKVDDTPTPVDMNLIVTVAH